MTTNDADQHLICRGCSETFVHSYGEQQWMREEWGGDYHPPNYCKKCRDKRRAAKEAAKRDTRPLHD